MSVALTSQSVALTAAPRNLSAIAEHIPLYQDLGSGIVVALVSILIVVALLVRILTMRAEVDRGPWIIAAIGSALLLSAFFVFPVFADYQQRRAAFTYGDVREATVTGQQQVGWPAIGWNIYRITADVIIEEGTSVQGSFTVTDSSIFAALSPGTRIQALYVPATGVLFFPLTIDVAIKADEQ